MIPGSALAWRENREVLAETASATAVFGDDIGAILGGKGTN
jgi:hypothetical protein